MAADASQALGAPQVAGTFVSPKGLTRKMTGAAAGGVVGAVIGGMGGAKETPAFGNLGYVAVTADELAIVKGKSGLFKPKVGTEVIARAPRGEVASVELDRGALKSALKIQFADGGSWEFEVPKVHKKTAEAVTTALGGSLT
jgi:hypothetical protein